MTKTQKFYPIPYYDSYGISKFGTIKDLSKKIGVTPSTISKIRDNKTWKT